MRIEDLMRMPTSAPWGLKPRCPSDADPENMSHGQQLTRCPPAEMPRKRPSLLMQSHSREKKKLTYDLGNDEQPRPTQIPRKSISATKRSDDARYTSRNLNLHKAKGHPTPQARK
ncbi:uncharacterized protein SCHCODRAFT_02571882 [Schizophyllum commune H4-8]|nr:uncharacterized protein SCHCODRAFT_02571882 [Schizophyllum commune H4-8]KAI5894945.1 hypothetical protein SCHCODRAFT_02571882 [Schizophyllum commune H4-8]